MTALEMLQAEIAHLRRLYDSMTNRRQIESMDLAIAVARLERVVKAMEPKPPQIGPWSETPPERADPWKEPSA